MKKKLLITRKLMAAMLSGAMVLSMAACGNDAGESSSASESVPIMI